MEGDRITFVGDAATAELAMRDTIALDGLLLTPGFIDMHSHITLNEAYGRPAVEFLTQGITTGVIGVDGASTTDLAALYAELDDLGVGKNIVSYIGHGSVREAVMGMDDRAPTADELDQMKAPVRKGMEDGAFGLSTGLFYTPGYYAEADEVIELGRAAAEYPIGGEHAPIYDTHDRDLGASYQGVGYHNSIREAIHIGAESGLRTIFSHFNAQGAHLYGRAAEGAAIIDSARAEGLEVAAAQHVHTSTMSSLRAYTIPRWAQAGGPEQMVRRFAHPDTARLLDVQTMEMLEIRGGPGKIVFADARPEFNGKTLADVAADRGLTVPEAVREIMSESNPWVMNRDLYDVENTRYLATMPWMMTCTDGVTPTPGAEIVHPRVYATFPKKINDFVNRDGAIGLPFAHPRHVGPRRGLPAAGRPRLHPRGAGCRHRGNRPGAVHGPRHVRRSAPVLRGGRPRARERPLRDPRRGSDRRTRRPPPAALTEFVACGRQPYTESVTGRTIAEYHQGRIR